MECLHKTHEVNIDLADAIRRHSADESIIYKEVNGEPIYLGYYFPEDYDRHKGTLPLCLFTVVDGQVTKSLMIKSIGRENIWDILQGIMRIGDSYV